MTQEQIEGNRIIASREDLALLEGFMGYAPGYLSEIIKWNDIMLVVERIDQLGYPVNICHNCTEMLGKDCPVSSGWEDVSDTRMSMCYKAIVEFIMWHNETKSHDQPK